MKRRFSKGLPVKGVPRTAILQLAVWVVLVVCPTQELSAQEPWHVAYESGVKAVREGQWELAEAKLKAAMRDGPSEGRNVKAYGVRFIDFIPSYYLGVVYFNQQKYEAALDELERAGSLGLVTERDSEYAQMKELLDRLKALLEPEKLPPPPPAPPEKRDMAPTGEEQQAEALIDHARALLEQEDVEGARKALESARAKDPGNSSIQVVGQRISEIEAGRLARAEQAAKEKEQRSQLEMESLLSAGERLLREGDFEEVRRLVARARADGITGARFDELAQRAEFEREIAELSKLVTAKRWSQARQKASQLSRRNPRDPELLRLQTAIDQGQAEARSDDLIQSGMRAFYSGSYQRAIEILKPVAEGEGRSAPALFYLACSRAALALWESNEERETLLSRARADFAESRRLDPRFPFDQRWISPRILSLLNEPSR